MIIINGRGWRVFMVSSAHPALRRPNGTWALGACDKTMQEIYIRDDLSEGKMKKVLAHEITHAAMFSYGVKLTYEQEEIVADILASYGYEIVNATNVIFNQLMENREAL